MLRPGGHWHTLAETLSNSDVYINRIVAKMHTMWEILQFKNKHVGALWWTHSVMEMLFSK